MNRLLFPLLLALVVSQAARAQITLTDDEFVEGYFGKTIHTRSYFAPNAPASTLTVPSSS